MTPNEKQNLVLAVDALEAVKAWPEHVLAWWHVTAFAAGAGAKGKAQVAEQVRQLRTASPQAEWFRQSALHFLTGDREHLVRQGRLAQEMPDAERWMAFTTLVWWYALSQAHGRTAFRQLFIDTGVGELLARMGAQLSGSSRRWPPKQGVARVALVAQHLSSGAHAGTAITFGLRALLEKAGVNTHIFSAQEMGLPAMSGYCAFGQKSSVQPADPASWQLRTPGEAQVSYSDPRYSLKARWQGLAQLIDNYDPDVVLFVGFTSPLLWALRERYPVVGLSLHTLPPLAPVDVWLAADPRPDGQHRWPGLSEPRAFGFPFRFWPQPPTTPIARAEIGVQDNAFLLVTTGTRLEAEITPAWADEVIAFLDANAHAHWLLVGLPQAGKAPWARRHTRIRVQGHKDDLAAWIAVCDLYLNPPRMGGGASVAMAMDLAVPVLALVGSDGGDKVGPMAVSTPGEYWARLREWAADSVARKLAGERQRAIFREELDLSTPAARERLVQACLLAQECFAARESRQAPSEITG